MILKYCCFCGKKLENIFSSKLVSGLHGFICICGSFIIRESAVGELVKSKFDDIKEEN